MVAKEPERCQIPLVNIFLTSRCSIESYFYFDHFILYGKIPGKKLTNFDHPPISPRIRWSKSKSKSRSSSRKKKKSRTELFSSEFILVLHELKRIGDGEAMYQWPGQFHNIPVWRRGWGGPKRSQMWNCSRERSQMWKPWIGPKSQWAPNVKHR